MFFLFLMGVCPIWSQKRPGPMTESPPPSCCLETGTLTFPELQTSVPLNPWIPLKNVPAPAGISIEEDCSIPLYCINQCPWQEVSSWSLQSPPSSMFLVWPCEVLSRLNVMRMFPLPLTILNLTAWNSSAQELSCQSVGVVSFSGTFISTECGTSRLTLPWLVRPWTLCL